MRQRGLAAYLVPGTDPHMSEYLPERWQRRDWMSGFTGSAGELVVLAKRAALWTDGRYFLQAETQLAGSGIDLCRQGEADTPTIEEYLCNNIMAGKKVGVGYRLKVKNYCI